MIIIKVAYTTATLQIGYYKKKGPKEKSIKLSK